MAFSIKVVWSVLSANHNFKILSNHVNLRWHTCFGSKWWSPCSGRHSIPWSRGIFFSSTKFPRICANCRACSRVFPSSPWSWPNPVPLVCFYFWPLCLCLVGSGVPQVRTDSGWPPYAGLCCQKCPCSWCQNFYFWTI